MVGLGSGRMIIEGAAGWASHAVAAVAAAIISNLAALRAGTGAQRAAGADIEFLVGKNGRQGNQDTVADGRATPQLEAVDGVIEGTAVNGRNLHQQRRR